MNQSDALEIPPDKEQPPLHLICWVGQHVFWNRRDTMYRPPGTLWRCPECLQWWEAKMYGTTPDNVAWMRVLPFTRAWRRIRKEAR